MTINSKVRWPFLFTVGLMTILLLPRPALAQEGKIDLTLTLLPGWYYYEATAGKDNIFFLEIRNTGSRAITDIRLSADKPEGWVIEFKPAEIDYLSPGSLQTVDVNIKPAGETAKGEYGVTLIAEANEIRKVESLRVTAQEEKIDLILTLFPRDYGNEVKVGEDNRLFLEVRNNGTKAVTHIRLSSEQPEGWTIEFRPGEIDYLGAGSVQTVDLIVKPDSKAAKGGYTVTLIAEANEIRKVRDIWLTVKSSFWLWLGAIIGAVVVAGFVFIFMRFGRQQK